jgi:LCP family protein required for cell wall assembly
MILCSLNPETKELSMISFLRDLYVQIPGHSDNRLNAAYVYGGFDLIKETLEHNFGVAVDGCLEVDFDSFESIIDILGGVDVELTAAEANIVGGDTHEGLCHLNGCQAQTYTRIRKIDSDFQRTERQRKLLSAMFTKMKDCTLPELMGLVNEILPLMTTDMSDDVLMSFAFNLASSLSELKIETYGVPSEGNYKNATINGMAVLVPDLYEIKKLIFEEYLPM